MAQKKIPNREHWLYTRFRWIRGSTTNPNHSDWHSCGAKGIKSWWTGHQFKQFAHYVETNLGRPQGDRFYLGRIDQAGDFAPGNLAWFSGKTLGNLHLANTFITYKKQTRTVKEWSEYYNINYHTLRARLARGWTFEQAVTKPLGKNYESRSTVSR
jgi:hypothetical protein